MADERGAMNTPSQPGMRKGVLLALAAACLLAAAWGPVSASGIASGLYSRNNSGCNGNVSDPMGIVFAGTHASAENVAKEIIRDGGWPFRGVGIGEDSQYANVYRQSTSFQCDPSTDGLASYGFGEFANDRYHVRIWLTWRAGGMPKTVGTPHWERLVNCRLPGTIGHAVPGESGFEFAWGNDLAVEQCNGWIAANGDGYVALVYVNDIAS